METINTGTVAILKELVKVNNERLEGFKKAAEETTELDLKTVFQSLGDESRKNAVDLMREIKKSGVEIDPASPATQAQAKGNRVWMGIKSALLGRDRNHVLNSCQVNEDAAQNAYKDAISSNELSTGVRQLIRNQQAALKNSYDWIKNYKSRSDFGYARSV